MTTRRIFTPGFISVFALLLATPAAAVAEQVEVEVWAIRATKKNAEVSPELRPHVDRLKKLGHTGFKLERRDAGKVEVGKEFRAGLIGAHSAAVTPTKRTGDKVEMKIVIKDGDKVILNTSVTLTAGQSQIIFGPELPGGDTLVVAVSGR